MFSLTAGMTRRVQRMPGRAPIEKFKLEGRAGRLEVAFRSRTSCAHYGALSMSMDERYFSTTCASSAHTHVEDVPKKMILGFSARMDKMSNENQKPVAPGTTKVDPQAQTAANTK